MDAVVADRHRRRSGSAGGHSRPSSGCCGKCRASACRSPRSSPRARSRRCARPSRSRLAMPNSSIISIEPPAALVVARGAGIDIALDLQRLAHIGADHPQQILVHPAFARQRPLAGSTAPPRTPGARPAPCRARRYRRHGRCWRTGRPPRPAENVGLTTVRSCRWPQVSHGSLVM